LEPSGADTNGDTESERKKNRRKKARSLLHVIARSVNDEAIHVFIDNFD